MLALRQEAFSKWATRHGLHGQRSRGIDHGAGADADMKLFRRIANAGRRKINGMRSVRSNRLCRPLALLLTLLCLLPVGAEPVSLTVWQNEKRYEVKPGDVIPLQRGSFFMVLPLAKEETVELAVGPAPRPEELQAFGDGKGMAGPYLGDLFLDWNAFHVFFYQYADADRRAELWDRQKEQAFFRVTGLQVRLPNYETVAVPFSQAPEIEGVLRKQGFDDLNFRVRWLDR